MSYSNYVGCGLAPPGTVWDMAPAIAVAVVKHNNPCGLAIGATAAEAHKKAHACDPMSAYGGVMHVNPRSLLRWLCVTDFHRSHRRPDYEPAALSCCRPRRSNRILEVAAEGHEAIRRSMAACCAGH